MIPQFIFQKEAGEIFEDLFLIFDRDSGTSQRPEVIFVGDHGRSEFFIRFGEAHLFPSFLILLYQTPQIFFAHLDAVWNGFCCLLIFAFALLCAALPLLC